MIGQQQRRQSLPTYTACNRQLTLALNPPEAHTVQGRHQSQALLAAAHRGTPHHLSRDRSHSHPLSKEVGRFGQANTLLLYLHHRMGGLNFPALTSLYNACKGHSSVTCSLSLMAVSDFRQIGTSYTRLHSPGRSSSLQSLFMTQWPMILHV